MNESIKCSDYIVCNIQPFVSNKKCTQTDSNMGPVKPVPLVVYLDNVCSNMCQEWHGRYLQSQNLT